ncbi:MAG: alpha/beta fold hydrolase [Actinomycetota bacterium]
MSGEARRSPGVVLAHGFTQTSGNWDLFADGLRTRRPDLDVRAVDLPGHGTATRLRRDLWGSARHLVHQGGAATYVGYSMGGRVALHAALLRPDLVDRLVLVGATAGIDGADERAARRLADERLADRLLQMSLAAFLDEWLSLPLFAGLDDEAAGRQHRLTNTRAGLASSLRLAGTGTQEPLWDRLDEIVCPTLILVGADDAKFRAIGERLVGAIPRAHLAVVAGAGHSVHLERPELTLDALAAFLDD